MRIRLSITLTFGDNPDDERYVDAIGTHHDVTSTETGLGFVSPGMEGNE